MESIRLDEDELSENDFVGRRDELKGTQGGEGSQGSEGTRIV
jgi:hypothetical protein